MNDRKTRRTRVTATCHRCKASVTVTRVGKVLRKHSAGVAFSYPGAIVCTGSGLRVTSADGVQP